MNEFERYSGPDIRKAILAESPYLSLYIDHKMDRGEKLEKLRALEASFDASLQKTVSPDWRLAVTSFLYCGLALGALTTKDDVDVNDGLVASMFYIGYELGSEDRMEHMWPDIEKQLTRMKFLPQDEGGLHVSADLIRHRKAFVWSVFLMAFETKDRQRESSRIEAVDLNPPASVISNSITAYINSLSSIDGIGGN